MSLSHLFHEVNTTWEMKMCRIIQKIIDGPNTIFLCRVKRHISLELVTVPVVNYGIHKESIHHLFYGCYHSKTAKLAL